MGFKPVMIKAKDFRALADACRHDYYKQPYAPESRKYNCPNCGAPITGSRCEYCGTRFGPEQENLKPTEKLEYQTYIPYFCCLGETTQ